VQKEFDLYALVMVLYSEGSKPGSGLEVGKLALEDIVPALITFLTDRSPAIAVLWRVTTLHG
jgi:hypothetical protein